MGFLKKLIFFLIAVLLLLTVIYFLGPRPDFPELDFKIEPIQKSLLELDTYVLQKDAGIANLKPNNESRIVWADSTKQKTEYAVVYLHGFSASPMEGDPVHLDFAKKYGMNIFLPRLAQHGIQDSEIFKTLSPKMLIDDAKEAIAIGKLLGEKVILMSCSTGGTLSIPLCAENPDMVDALIMYSPNFALYDSRAELISGPWGLEIGRKIQGSNYRQLNMPASCHGYWTMEYRLEGVVALQVLIDETMKEEYFKKIDDPIYAAYYYESEEKQDKIISTKAINQFLDLVATPSNQIQIETFPTTKSHVIISSLLSKDVQSVQNNLDDFATKVLKLSSSQ